MIRAALAILFCLGSISQGVAADAKAGTVTGQIMYPSDYIPDDLNVCAESLGNGKTVCTAKRAKGKGGKTVYRLDLPAGDYHVYAKLTDPASFGGAYGADYRAYYSAFVTCGLLASCTSHKPIVVKVKAGKTVGGIDPADWYDF